METLVTSPASTEPGSTTRQEIAGVTETSNDSLIPPGAEPQPTVPPTAEEQVETLRAFLEAQFPGEVALSNRQVPETSVETAMRLLMGRQARADYASPRCTAEWCNKAVGHSDAHGFIHYD